MSKFFKFFFIACTFSALSLYNIAQAATHESTQPTQHLTLSIENHDDIRVVYDVKEDVWEAGVGKALYFVRGLVESYKSIGVSPEKLHISVVMHGGTAYWLLKDSSYQMHTNDPFGYNPNDHVVSELIALGVSVEICNSTMKAKGWTGNDLLPDVTIVHDAYTRFIDLQNRRYSYIRF